MIINRETYLRKLRPFVDQDLIKVLTGFRRSGKSVLLGLIQKELLNNGVQENQFISLNFEQRVNLPFTSSDSFYDEVGRRIKAIDKKAYLFFDEIQEVDGWEQAINSLRVDYDCDMYITGSNAKLLSGELVTYLAGRYVEFTVYPFSFAEYVMAREDQNPKDLFMQFIEFGGMPYLLNQSSNKEVSMQYLNDLYHSAVLKDIVQRHNIRDVALLRRVLMFVIAHIGTSFSAYSISKYFKAEHIPIAPSTIEGYLRAVEDSFILHQVKRYDLEGKKLLTTNAKYYVTDHGLREAILGTNEKDINLVLENIVFLELKRRGYMVTTGNVKGREIDFIAEQEGKRIYVQVAYLLASEETITREFGVYKLVQDNYPKYVLTLDEIDFSRNGIKHHHIRNFLLMEDWG